MSAADEMRLAANDRVDPGRKSKLGQFMTPSCIADFMASLFSEVTAPVRLLDAGAGTGSLTAAFLKRWVGQPVSITAYEIDPSLLFYLRHRLAPRDASIISRDFIQEAVYRLKSGGRGKGYSHAILNPPYKKIHSGSVHRALLRSIGLETVNLYTAFVGLSIELMADGGEVVAILPRSFCNGLYYRPFRDWILARAAIHHIHLFHSRTSAFQDDEVLQENVIVKLVRGVKQGSLTVTTASDASLSDLRSHRYKFSEIVLPGDAQKYIHIPTDPSHTCLADVPLARRSLGELGLEVSTGPVVDFRLKPFLRERPEQGTVPLLYPTHFTNGVLEWPRESKKPNALKDDPKTRKWLYPNGFYTIVRRFSSKEERRRIVAHVVDPAVFDARTIGFENHLNVFHSGRRGIDGTIAHGLSIFLNSTHIDDYFRRFSGHTQVNATDLRLLRYPEMEDLKKLGRWAKVHARPTQEMIDEQVAALDAQTRSNC